MSSDLPWLDGAALFGSGRDALVALVRWGAARDGWRRIWLPSYNCPEVPAALLATDLGVELVAYPDADLEEPADLDAVAAEAGDVLVVVNQLGLRPRPDVSRARDRGLVVVEDHSHDLASAWALGSEADFAFASLRKTLPIPDGGAVWSPRRLGLPPEPKADSGRQARRVADALERRATDSSAQLRYRALARSSAGSGEPAAGAAVSDVSRALLPQMPVQAWREQRRRNLEILAEAVGPVAGVRMLRPPAGAVSFALTLLFHDTAARDAARRALVRRAVVPRVLWPLTAALDWGVGLPDVDLGRRILSVHGDQRFDEGDMRRLAEILREALAG